MKIVLRIAQVIGTIIIVLVAVLFFHAPQGGEGFVCPHQAPDCRR